MRTAFWPERPFWVHTRSGEDNIKIELKERGYGFVDWIHLAQDRERERNFKAGKYFWPSYQLLYSAEMLSNVEMAMH
jgi:hypothetical protein